MWMCDWASYLYDVITLSWVLNEQIIIGLRSQNHILVDVELF